MGQQSLAGLRAVSARAKCRKMEEKRQDSGTGKGAGGELYEGFPLFPAIDPFSWK
jgi:hypothetical protein